MPEAILLNRPDVGMTVAALRSGSAFTELRVDSAAERAAALETVLGICVDDDTLVTWVGNPLRSALTIERFLLQIIGPEVDLRIDRSPAELADLLGQPVADGKRRLVVVQQPETIDPETRDLLGATAGFLRGATPPIRFLFVGSLAFRPLSISPPSPPTSLVPVRTSVGPQAASVSGPRLAARFGDNILPVIFLLCVAGIALATALTRAKPGQSSEPPPVRVILAPTSPADRSVALLKDSDLLRKHFDAFLAERASELPPLTKAQKDELFGEFLARPRSP